MLLGTAVCIIRWDRFWEPLGPQLGPILGLSWQLFRANFASWGAVSVCGPVCINFSSIPDHLGTSKIELPCRRESNFTNFAPLVLSSLLGSILDPNKSSKSSTRCSDIPSKTTFQKPCRYGSDSERWRALPSTLACLYPCFCWLVHDRIAQITIV